MNDAFFATTRSKLRTILRRRRNSEIKARFDESDVVQESVLQIWKQIDAGNLSESKVNTGLLKTIAAGHYCKLVRFHLSSKRNVNAETSQNSFLTRSSDFSSLEESASVAEQVELLMSGVEKLDPVDQQIVLGRFIEGHTVVHLSEELSLSVYLIKKRLRDSIAKLERFLDSSVPNSKRRLNSNETS